MLTVHDIAFLGNDNEKMEQHSKFLDNVIKNHVESKEYKFLLTAERYYDSHNDIEKLDFRKYTADGVEMINPNRSNERISHNFFLLLVEQAVSYIAGNPITYKVDDEKLQEYLTEVLGFEFEDVCVQWITQARVYRRGYIHAYIDDDGAFKYAVIPTKEIIPIYKDSFNRELYNVIRFYTVNGVDKEGQPAVRYAVEWWTDTNVMKFVQDSECLFRLASIIPHWAITNTATPEYEKQLGWGRVPFVELQNNDSNTSDLEPIKKHVDAYDLIASEFINQLADIREILIKVLGYSATEASEILKAFRSTGLVKIDDANGDIDVLKSEIPVEARNAVLKMLEDNIYRLGRGVNINPEKIGTSISGIAIKMLYGNLDLKCAPMIRKLNKALHNFTWFVCEEYNRGDDSGANDKNIKFVITKNLPVNEAEIIENIAKSKGIVSDETLLQNHPLVDNVSEELDRLEKQTEKEVMLYEGNQQ